MRYTSMSASRLVVGACAAVLAAYPALALAEEENTGMKLLIPNMAEFIPACIAFIIIFVVLSKLAWPTVLEALEAREKKIADDLDAAASVRAEAEQAQSEINEKIAEAERKAQEIVAEATHDGQQERQRIVSEAQAAAQDIVAKAHANIDEERTKAMIELSGQVVDLSVEIAGKIIGEALDEDEHRELVKKYLSEMGSLNDDD